MTRRPSYPKPFNPTSWIIVLIILWLIAIGLWLADDQATCEQSHSADYCVEILR